MNLAPPRAREARAVVYRFGDFTLDGATRQLLLNGEEIHLAPKAFDMLSVLVANRSRAMSKDELQQHLWPTTFVEETNLAGLVTEIRRALRDSAATPLFIRTVYGFGYQFVGDVTADQPPTRQTPDRTRLSLFLERREMMLMEGANVIGRASDATIQVDSPGVSRYHAKVVVSGREATLEDIRSKNGTYLNGTRVRESSPLGNGDEIRVGSVVMTFKLTTATTPTATLPDSSDPSR
jgi:DNA-binding winged helix-turn-helix (wHTH) protein